MGKSMLVGPSKLLISILIGNRVVGSALNE
jgi:hypothetical protein